MSSNPEPAVCKDDRIILFAIKTAKLQFSEIG
jgi:hypothetical protein